jgi:hypothetical protein
MGSLAAVVLHNLHNSNQFWYTPKTAYLSTRTRANWSSSARGIVRSTAPVKLTCAQLTGANHIQSAFELHHCPDLSIGGHFQLRAGLQKCQSVILPSLLLIEVGREKPACFVREERVHTDGLPAQEMLLDDGVGHREELPCFLSDLLALLGPAFVDRFPVLYVGRHITVSPILAFPTPLRTSWLKALCNSPQYFFDDLADRSAHSRIPNLLPTN